MVLGRTHALAGLVIGLFFIKFLVISSFFQSVIFVLLVLFGALFPDVDTPSSLLGRKIKPLSSFFSHRGIFHSFFILALFALLIFLLSSFLFAFAFMVGFISHVLLDMLSKEGLRVFPFKKKIKGFIRVGSWKETIFVLLLFFLLILIF